MAPRLLTDFELMLMLAMVRVGEEAYAIPIAREIKATAGRNVALGPVYAALERLEDRGFVASRMGPPTAERGGRAKRYFHLTPKGLRAVREMHRALSALWMNMPELKGQTL